jgi:hypothetical protein
VLRLIGGLATVTGVTAPWVDPLATWMSWLAPLVAFELSELAKRNGRRSSIQSALSSSRRLPLSRVGPPKIGAAD